MQTEVMEIGARWFRDVAGAPAAASTTLAAGLAAAAGLFALARLPAHRAAPVAGLAFAAASRLFSAPHLGALASPGGAIGAALLFASLTATPRPVTFARTAGFLLAVWTPTLFLTLIFSFVGDSASSAAHHIAAAFAALGAATAIARTQADSGASPTACALFAAAPISLALGG